MVIKTEAQTKNSPTERTSKFSSAYTIKGRGVGHLELKRAAKSQEFIKETKSLVEKLQILKENQVKHAT